MRRFAVAIAFVLAVACMFGCDNSSDDLKSLARQEASGGVDLLGIGNCRIVNTLEALKVPGSFMIFGTVKNSKGEYRHMWAMDKDGQMIDKVCGSDQPGCQIRGYRAVIRTSDLAVMWVAPGDESWRESYAYTKEFVAARRQLNQKKKASFRERKDFL